jgi:hypothetical protein
MKVYFRIEPWEHDPKKEFANKALYEGFVPCVGEKDFSGLNPVVMYHNPCEYDWTFPVLPSKGDHILGFDFFPEAYISKFDYGDEKHSGPNFDGFNVDCISWENVNGVLSPVVNITNENNS